MIAAFIDIEELREQRAMMHANFWVDMRFEPFKEIYENSIYPPNLFLEHPPESLAQKMEGEIQAYRNLYERGTFTRPSLEEETIEQRLKRAQRGGTLKA